MDINEKKIKVMLQEHESRGGELEYMLEKLLKKRSLTDEEKVFFNTFVQYYRHVGAIWLMKGLLNGKTFDWGLVEVPGRSKVGEGADEDVPDAE